MVEIIIIFFLIIIGVLEFYLFKKAKKRLQANYKQLESKYISKISHELLSPLTAVKEAVGLMLDGAAGEINEEQKDFLGIAAKNLEKLHKYVSDILEFK